VVNDKSSMHESLAKLYPFKSNFFQVGGVKIHYLDQYLGDGIPRGTIVMVHGNPTWSFLFRHQISELSKEYRCIAIDHLGCGLSDKPKEYNYCLENHISNLRALVDHLELKQIFFMLHDWGGAIGSGVATAIPERVAGITILNSAAFPSKEIPWRINFLRAPLLGSFLIKQFNAFAWPATWMATDRPLSKEVRAAYLHPYRRAKDRIAIARFVADIPMSSSHPSYPLLSKIEQRLRLIKNIPTQIIWGEDDFCFTNHFLARWMEILPHAETHLLTDCGHYVTEDGKVELTIWAKKFFDANSSPK
jgi:cis-3-alkyl-4-acyloxetan-2-one decarboxylase